MQLGGKSDSEQQELVEFETALREQLQRWRSESIRGVWLHIPPSHADKVGACIRQGFQFHMVLNNDDSTSAGQRELVLTQWLPKDTPNRLPLGPTHQVGVGCLVWHPHDDHLVGSGERRMLVVQEKTGPAAAYGLWKMPTGLADPGEDLHRASERELVEETGLRAKFTGLVGFRQAHASRNASPISTSDNNKQQDGESEETPSSSKKKKASFSRKVSDLFFICQLELPSNVDDDTGTGKQQHDAFLACPDEIAAIQWMKVQDFCGQHHWSKSPIFMQFNQALLGDPSSFFSHSTLPLRVDSEHSNTIYTVNMGQHHESKE